MAATKIATCCYCGTRAALALKGDVRHELACAQCGAPLSKMKMLKAEPEKVPTSKRHTVDHRSRPERSRPKKVSRRKSLKKRVLSEVWDAIEDIFD